MSSTQLFHVNVEVLAKERYQRPCAHFRKNLFQFHDFVDDSVFGVSL